MDKENAAEMSGSEKREFLRGVLLDAVRENAAGMEIGLVRAVLNEVDGRIAMLANRSSIDTVWENERMAEKIKNQ